MQNDPARRIIDRCVGTELDAPYLLSTAFLHIKDSSTGRCIMKERPLQKVEAGCGAASAALRCAGLRSATAARRSNSKRVSGGKGLQESIGKRAEEWHFTLRESQPST